MLVCALCVIERYDYLNFVLWFVSSIPQNIYVSRSYLDIRHTGTHKQFIEIDTAVFNEASTLVELTPSVVLVYDQLQNSTAERTPCASPLRSKFVLEGGRMWWSISTYKCCCSVLEIFNQYCYGNVRMKTLINWLRIRIYLVTVKPRELACCRMKQAMWRSCSAMSVAELFVTILLLFSAHYVSGFSCVCSPSECEELSESDCPGGGTVWDPCGCCRVCARVENEPCGGPYGFYGTCAVGLECVVAAHATGKPVLAANSEGICTRK